MEKSKEKAKIKRFYIAFSVIWLIAVLVYFIGKPMMGANEDYDPIFNIILVFLVILIPVILVISIPLFYAEGIMDRIKAKMDARNETKQ